MYFMFFWNNWKVEQEFAGNRRMVLNLIDKSLNILFEAIYNFLNRLVTCIFLFFIKSPPGVPAEGRTLYFRQLPMHAGVTSAFAGLFDSVNLYWAFLQYSRVRTNVFIFKINDKTLKLLQGPKLWFLCSLL